MASNPALKLVKKFGSNGKVGRKFGVTREAVRQWLEKGIPADRALEAEEISDGDISALDVLRFAKQQQQRAA
jgi:DNA-directed RNA polymerase sigma subunit (sigma70/sigma32)